MPLSPGQILNNRYRIVKLLGQGGFGAVYRAWDMNLNCPCALKENLDISPEAQRQFKREAQILDKLSHPNLPKVIDHFIIPSQGQSLVMEFVEGRTWERNCSMLACRYLWPIWQPAFRRQWWMCWRARPSRQPKRSTPLKSWCRGAFRPIALCVQ